MIEITGNVAKLFVGYRVAITLRDWKLVKKNEPIGNIATQGIGTIDFIDPILSCEEFTRITFFLNQSRWVWRVIDFPSSGLKVGDKVDFRVIGDPDVN